MRKRVVFGSGVVLLAILATLVVWQVSFTFGDYAPSSPTQTSIYWAVSTLIFLLTVTLGFMLFRTAVKLYIERQSNRAGSRIKTKLVAGALALSCVPVVFLVQFSYVILNHNLDKWFGKPGENVKNSLVDLGTAFDDEMREKAGALANWLAAVPETTAAIESGIADHAFFAKSCADHKIGQLTLDAGRGQPLVLCTGPESAVRTFAAQAPVVDGGRRIGTLYLLVRPPETLAGKSREIADNVRRYEQMAANRHYFRNVYTLLLVLITLFVLFAATWIALILARQISVPISALLDAAGEVRKGNLAYRVHVSAVDELATLVRAFNDMTRDLDANSRELESRRRFTEAILESIPTGVISLHADGRIQRVNRALKSIFAEEEIARATRLEDLFSRDDTAEIKYLMKRARRTGTAASQLDFKSHGRMLHLAVTVSALEEKLTSGFVLVLEDTSELLRAQRAAAWQEVARRIAHELKNPLTPITLSAERIARQLERSGASPEAQRIVRECANTITREVESVKNLADEFSQFSRFPTAQPVPSDLNEIVRIGLGVFDGRLG